MIGSTVWLFDGNRRHYADGGFSAPIYRGHFIEYTITGETRSSWIVGKGLYKISKSTGRLRSPSKDGFYGLSPIVYYSAEEVTDACWMHDNRHRIADLLRNCGRVKLLRKVDAMLNEGDS